MASSTAAARSRQAHSALNSDDAVAMRAAEVAAWARRNTRTIILAAVLLGAVVLGLIAWKMMEASKRNQAAAAFLTLQQDPTVVTAAGAPKLEAFIRAHGGTLEADEARMMLAEVRLRANQPKQAVQPARQVAEGGGPMAIQGAMLLGDAHFQAGDRAAAIAAYERAAEQADLDMHRYDALSQAAAVHESAGAHAQAAKVYERMLADMEKGSDRRTYIEMRLAEARARAGGR
ncbi:MAG TPA: tetratricopeptide repeat protein [Longimicrobium sp.]|nr:tetratricopeptide repeat protein [Longimicrobium sp.]